MLKDKHPFKDEYKLYVTRCPGYDYDMKGLLKYELIHRALYVVFEKILAPFC